MISDPELNGGGLHEIKSGGMLKIHTDFRKHPSLDLDRRINVLIYLNKNWSEKLNKIYVVGYPYEILSGS